MNKLLLSITLALFVATGLSAQSVKVVEAQYDADGFPVPDVLINEINADTSDTGALLHDVYMLELNEAYTITSSIVLNSPATLTAPPHDRMNADAKPPEVRVQANADGSQPSVNFVLVRPGANVEVSNIYFSGMTTADAWLEGNFLRPAAPDITIHLKNLIIDYMGWSTLTNLDGDITGVSYISDNVYVKNAQNPGDFNSPFYILNFAPIDTFIVRNVTYFQSHGFFMQSRQPMNYVEIDHSTIANALKIPIFNDELTNAKITNNIFFNTTASGENDVEHRDKDRDGLTWSIVNVDTLAGNEPGGTDAPMAEADRQIEVRNNVWYKTPELLAFMGDTLRTGVFMNDRTQAMFDDDAGYPGLVEENNHNMEISFANLTEPGRSGKEATAEMLDYIRTVRTGQGTVDFWGFEGDVNMFPVIHRLLVEWPMEEDLRHNITDVVDDNGNPIGSLAWFPEINVATEEDVAGVSDAFSLGQNYPNPFNPSTTLHFALGSATSVTLEVFNVMGQKVATLLNNELLAAGAHQQVFNATDLSSGLYIYKMHTADAPAQSRKMLLMK